MRCDCLGTAPLVSSSWLVLLGCEWSNPGGRILHRGPFQDPPRTLPLASAPRGPPGAVSLPIATLLRLVPSVLSDSGRNIEVKELLLPASLFFLRFLSSCRFSIVFTYSCPILTLRAHTIIRCYCEEEKSPVYLELVARQSGEYQSNFDRRPGFTGVCKPRLATIASLALGLRTAACHPIVPRLCGWNKEEETASNL